MTSLRGKYLFETLKLYSTLNMKQILSNKLSLLNFSVGAEHPHELPRWVYRKQKAIIFKTGISVKITTPANLQGWIVVFYTVCLVVSNLF